ncbi:phytoene desaturase family protein [Paenibacillus cremeus]|nr:FAD-dependent oxidoreductase [Paenibacillus cremeus]
MKQNHNEPKWDVAIIGAGIAGLTASIFLAKAGMTVLILDKGSHAGGRAASTEIASAQVNLGAHALYKSALPILREVGVIPSGAAPKPLGTFVFEEAGGGKKAVPFAQLLLGSFLKWHEKTQLLRFYSRFRNADTSTLHRVSLQDYLESQISSPRVRSVVLAFVRVSTYCDAPEQLSAGAVIDQLKHGQVMYVDGGWQTLVSALNEQALLAGVSIRMSAPVREIAGSYPEMTVTLKDGMQLTTSHVLSTAGPTDTLALLNPSLTPEEAAVYKQLIPVHAVCLDLVVLGMPQPHTKFVLGADYPWYYSNHSAAASLSDHPGHHVVHVMKYLSDPKGSDAQQDERELNGFLDFIQPGWRKHVIEERFLPRMLVSHGVVTANSGGLSGRPGSAVEGRPGLYVAGDWVGSEGMLVNASLASAKEAARGIIAGSDQDKEGIHRGA